MATELADVIVADATAEDDLTDGRGGLYHNVLSAIHAGDIDNDEPEERIKAYAFFRAMHRADAQPDADARPTSVLPPPKIVAENYRLDKSDTVLVRFDPTTKWARVRFTTDGSEPTAASPMYRKPFVLNGSALDALKGAPLVLKARAFSGSQCSEAIASATFARAAPKTLSESRATLRALPDAVVSGVLRAAGRTAGWMRENAAAFVGAIGRAASDAQQQEGDAAAAAAPAPATIAVKIVGVSSAPGDARSSELRFAIEITEPRACADQEQREPRPRRTVARGGGQRAAHARRLPAARAAPSLAARVAAALTGERLRSALKTDVSLEVASGVTVKDVEQRALRKVRLELRWRFPEGDEADGDAGGALDFLDGSALAYAGEELLDVVDYRGALRRKSARWRRAIGAHPDGRINPPASRDQVKPAVGDEVEAPCKCFRARPREDGGGASDVEMREWFTGRVVAEGPSGDSVRVRFDDGMSDTVKVAQLRPCGALDRAHAGAARAVMAAVRHSGDDNVDREARVGSQSVEIDLGELAGAAGAPGRAVTDIYFALSAWRCRSLARFGAPAVRLIDAERPEHELCEYSVASAGDAQAVVMAALVRAPDGRWRVDAFGTPTKGNVEDYAPLRAEIAPLQRERASEAAVGSQQRAEVARLAALWSRGRALPTLGKGTGAARGNASAALATLFDLECEDALRRVVSFL